MKTSSDNAAENLFQTFLLINAIYSQAKERTILSDTYSHYVLTGFTAYLVFCKHNCYKKKRKKRKRKREIKAYNNKNKELSSGFETYEMSKRPSPEQE